MLRPARECRPFLMRLAPSSSFLVLYAGRTLHFASSLPPFNLLFSTQAIYRAARTGTKAHNSEEISPPHHTHWLTTLLIATQSTSRLALNPCFCGSLSLRDIMLTGDDFDDLPNLRSLKLFNCSMVVSYVTSVCMLSIDHINSILSIDDSKYVCISNMCYKCVGYRLMILIACYLSIFVYTYVCCLSFVTIVCAICLIIIVHVCMQSILCYTCVCYVSYVASV